MSENEEKVVSLSNARGKEKNKVNKEKADNTQDISGTQQQPVYCSFCGRPNTQVVKMIEGPGVNICSECTMIAVQYFILEDRIPSQEAKKILASLWSATDK